MFKEIVSQLSFSPATVERLSAYASNVKREQYISGWASIVLCFVLLIHLITLFLPPSTSYVASSNDLITGGFTSKDMMLLAYDDNTEGFRDAVDLLKISRSDLVDSKEQPAAPTLTYTTGLTPYADDSERGYNLPIHTVYLRHADASHYLQHGWQGVTSDGNPFYITANDGNIFSAALPSREPNRSKLSYSHTVGEITANKTIQWKLVITNDTNSDIQEDVEFSVADIEEYATIETPFGAISSDAQHLIVWPGTLLSPGESKTVFVTAHIDMGAGETPLGIANTRSYDCALSSAFGNAQEWPVPCSPIKRIELISHQLPQITSIVPTILYISLSAISLLSYLSLRQRSKEIRIIRTQLNTGGS